MSTRDGAEIFSARVASGAYVVLAGIWFVLALVYATLALADGGHQMWIGVSVAFLAGLIWSAWLRGFHLEIGKEELEYRDGLYRSVAVPLKEIREVKSGWIQWKLLGRHLRVPRLLIAYGPQGNRLAINTKPFRKRDIHLAMELLRKTHGENGGEGSAKRCHQQEIPLA